MKIAFLSHLDMNLYLFRRSWMEALQREGHTVTAIMPRGRYFDRFREHGIEAVEFTIERQRHAPMAELGTLWRLYRLLRSERFDVLHTFTIKPNIYGALTGKMAGIPLVINHVTGLGYVFTGEGAKVMLLRILVSFLYRITFGLADKVVFQNPDDLAALKHLVSPRKTVVIKGTGIDTAHFSIESADRQKVKGIRDTLGISEQGVVVTMIGRLLWHKGIREFVEAAESLSKRHSDLDFLIVGWIDEGNPAAADKEFIGKVTQNKRIHFLGEREDIREILAATDIYVLPSYREGTPRTVLEAMAMARPVVTTDVPGCRQTVDNELNGLLVPPKDSLSLAKALDTLIRDKGKREEMGRAGREKVLREFADSVVIEQITKLYSDCGISLKASSASGKL